MNNVPIGYVIGLDLFTVLSVILIFAVGPYIKKIINNYFLWIGIGVALLTYLLVFRFYDEFSSFWANGNDYGVGTSRGLLLDICPFCAFTICVTIIIDPTRKIAKIIAPFALFGGLITIIGGIQDEMVNMGNDSIWHYIFVGDSWNPMYFMMHYINVAVGSLILVSVPKMRFSDWIYCNLFAGFYYSYVAICMLTLKVTNNVSGLNINDWADGGEYSGVAQMFKVSPGVAAAIGFALSYSCISLFIFLQNRLQLWKRYRWYNMFNKKTWYVGWYQLHPTKIQESQSLIVKGFNKIFTHHKTTR